MHGVDPGTVLGRYTTTRREQPLAGAERWTAHDADLDRDVVLLVMPTDGEHTDAVLDAGRRAAGVSAPSLVRILDVDTDGPLSWVAEEHLAGARSLADLVGDGLPAEEVRRIVGEAATGLGAARTRGLHHLALTPGSVLVDGSGDVHVRGLATEAALAGIDETDDEGVAADSADAMALVGLAYAGLTGRWPLDGDGGGLPAAPREGGAVVPPSRLVDGVKTDLETICHETLAEGAGPLSPGDLAAQISPWSKMPFVVAGPVDDASTVAAPRPVAEDDSPTSEIPALRVPPAAADARTETVPTRSSTGGDQPTEVVERDDALGVDESPRADDGSPRADRGKAAAAAAGAAATTVIGAVAGGSKVLGERVGSFAHRTRERASEAATDRRAQRAAIRSSEERDRVSLGGAGSVDDIEPPAPLLPAAAGGPPSKEQANAVLAIMAGFVALATILGCWGFTKIGDNTDLGAIFGSDAQPTAVKTTDPASESPTEEPSGPGSQAEPIAVLSAVGYDPVGGDGEHNSEAQRVYDGNVSTSWTTEGYQAPNFGNKGGVGLVLDLGQATTVTTATLQLPTATTVQVFVGDAPGVDGTEIGRSEGKDGQVELTARTPAKGQLVTVWFTTTTQSDDGRHRASLSEIVLR